MDRTVDVERTAYDEVNYSVATWIVLTEDPQYSLLLPLVLAFDVVNLFLWTGPFALFDSLWSSTWTKTVKERRWERVPAGTRVIVSLGPGHSETVVANSAGVVEVAVDATQRRLLEYMDSTVVMQLERSDVLAEFRPSPAGGGR